MKEFLSKHKKSIINVILLLVALIVISFVSMLILQAFGILYYDEGVHLNEELFRSFTNSWYGWFIIIGMQVVITTLLCFIPGTSMAFILMVQAMFEKPWQAFLVAFIGVMLSSLIMYLTGRLGGYKICKKLMGEEDAKKASELMNKNGLVYFPIMMMFPIFPDDALVMTKKEVLDIAQRMLVAKMLSEQIVYNKIVEETGASTATISRVNRSYLYGAGGYKKALEAIAEDAE